MTREGVTESSKSTKENMPSSILQSFLSWALYYREVSSDGEAAQRTTNQVEDNFAVGVSLEVGIWSQSFLQSKIVVYFTVDTKGLLSIFTDEGLCPSVCEDGESEHRWWRGRVAGKGKRETALTDSNDRKALVDEDAVLPDEATGPVRPSMAQTLRQGNGARSRICWIL